MIIRVGLPSARGRIAVAAFRADLPVLVSANPLWNPARNAFNLHDCMITDDMSDVALDSSGFVAMVKYGGYRWNVAQYLELVAWRPWTWWAQMDLCCEPEVAGNEDEIQRRLTETAAYLSACREGAAFFRSESWYIADPMPVLQGWRPEHYEQSAFYAHMILMGRWPEIVGVGSVCRRPIEGPDGLLAIVGCLDRVLPRGVRLHLFGVKSGAVERLANHPRIASVDSMAWDYASRVEARQEGASNTSRRRIRHLLRWYSRQERRSRPAQGDLFGRRP